MVRRTRKKEVMGSMDNSNHRIRADTVHLFYVKGE
jgi:hypothetical protein